MATPQPVPAETSLHRLLDLLVKAEAITPDQRKEVLGRAGIQRARLLNEQRAAVKATGRRRMPEITDAEVVASFHLPLLTKSDRSTTLREVDQSVIAEALAREAGIPFERLDPLKLDFGFVTRTLSGPFAEKHFVVPLALEDGKLKVAVANPFDTAVLEQLPRITGFPVRPVVATYEDIRKIATEFWGFRRSVTAAQADLGANVDLGNLEQFVRGRGVGEIDPTDKPVVQAVWYLFNYAFDQRASDIHIEPKREQSQVRLRIDGVLHDIYTLPKLVHQAVVSRIKMLARMDIAEKRKPQDGRIKTTFKEQEIELRVSSVPVAFGEKVVLRVFDPEVLLKDLEEIGFFPRELQLFQEWIARPNGLILVTGPTGSGKTTTLYSALKVLSSPEVNITTIEDPIEMVCDDFNQIGVQSKSDLNFGNVLRNVLRQDPDVIMVGEIRDRETAENAIQAALTGHLVLSTLHTNDAASAVTRLLDLEIPPFLISSTLIGVAAQRLLRTVCDDCGRDAPVAPEQLAALGFKAAIPITARVGEGCPRCRGTGYRGRTGIFVLLPTTPRLAKLVAAKATAREIKAEAIAEGMMTLRESAVRKLAQGATTYEEVVRVTAADR